MLIEGDVSVLAALHEANSWKRTRNRERENARDRGRQRPMEYVASGFQGDHRIGGLRMPTVRVQKRGPGAH